MTMIKVVSKGDKLEKPIEQILKEYEKFIYKICNGWIKTFRFDRSLEVEDLVQDLKLKFLNDLHNYDCNKNEHIIPYMRKIANNFFISKKSEILSNNKCPVNGDSQPEMIISLYSGISRKVNSAMLIESIVSYHFLPNRNIDMREIVKKVQDDLDQINYCPRNFVKRLRSFCRVVFDTIYFQDKKFTEFVLFNFRCKRRYAMKKKNKSVPRTITINADTVSKYLKVKISAVNYANREIRKTIMENIKEGGLNG